MIDINELIEKGLISNRHAAIYDYKFQTNMRDAPWYNWLDKSGYFECKDEYLKTIHNWINSTSLNSVLELDRFKYRDLIVGTTQTFDEAYYEHASKRLRVFRGEYAYHSRAFRNISFLDSVNGNYLRLGKHEWVIISLPFCGDGTTHKHMNTMLDDALENNVPVVVDCAWFGTCRDMIFDFSHPAITSVSFSLSKGIGLGNMRSGIRYSNNENRNLPIAQQNLYNHLVLIAAQVGIHQMNTFSPDFTPSKYYEAYQHMCKKIDLIPTNCLHIAMAPEDNIWNQFLIDGIYRKIGIRNLVKEVYKGNIL